MRNCIHQLCPVIELEHWPTWVEGDQPLYCPHAMQCASIVYFIGFLGHSPYYVCCARPHLAHSFHCYVNDRATASPF